MPAGGLLLEAPREKLSRAAPLVLVAPGDPWRASLPPPPPSSRGLLPVHVSSYTDTSRIGFRVPYASMTSSYQISKSNPISKSGRILRSRGLELQHNFPGDIMPHELTSHRHFCRWEAAAGAAVVDAMWLPPHVHRGQGWGLTWGVSDSIPVGHGQALHLDTSDGGWGDARGKVLLPAHLLCQGAYQPPWPGAPKWAETAEQVRRVTPRRVTAFFQASCIRPCSSSTSRLRRLSPSL